MYKNFKEYANKSYFIFNINLLDMKKSVKKTLLRNYFTIKY